MDARYPSNQACQSVAVETVVRLNPVVGQNRANNETQLEISVDNLYKSFGSHDVLRGINLTIEQGEIVAIVGASGSGKSVLLKHLTGALRPDSGRVLMADHEAANDALVDLGDLDEAGLDRLRRHWGVVFQKNALFSGTVFENVALGLAELKDLCDADICARVRAVLDDVGLNYDVVASMTRDQVSGGMAKRVAIARALALQPVVLFYDEPTTGLDPDRANQIQQLITHVHTHVADIGVRRTTVIITHDISLLFRVRPRIVMLHDGGVLFDGTTQAFLDTDLAPIKPYRDFMPSYHATER